MSKARSVPQKPAYVPPSEVVWTEERLAALSTTQLINLLANLQTQRASGRVSEATAADLEVRIRARLPARALVAKRTRPRREVLLEARAAEQLGALATDIARRYDISPESATKASAGIRGFRPQPLTDSKGRGRAGASVRGGHAAIERFVAYRRGDSFASLAFILLAGKADGHGRYVLLGTDDVLGAEVTPNEYADVAEQHGWSTASRARMRAEPVAGFDEGAERYEALIARMAAPLQ
ncbi:MAG TPA: hypothetical protein PLE54_14815 [Burkholderiaceae bacterium]|nr:hypothetical protein [Burkholderiaceae bacterium]HQR71880.1 hypothetical protein [Burkholderiaceae bacterium]